MVGAVATGHMTGGRTPVGKLFAAHDGLPSVAGTQRGPPRCTPNWQEIAARRAVGTDCGTDAAPGRVTIAHAGCRSERCDGPPRVCSHHAAYAQARLRRA